MIIVLLLIFCLVACGKDVILKTTEGPGFINQVRVSDSLQDKQETDTLIHAFSLAHKTDSIVRLVIYSSLQDAQNTERPKGVTDLDFPSWQKMYLEQKNSAQPAIEFTRIGSRAALRHFGANGSSSEDVQGFASLQQSIGEPLFLIVGTSLSRPMYLDHPITNLNLYFMYSESKGSKPLQDFVNSLRIKVAQNVTILLSPEARNINSDNYPYFNRFIPSELYHKFGEGQWIFCSAMRGSVFDCRPEAK